LEIVEVVYTVDVLSVVTGIVIVLVMQLGVGPGFVHWTCVLHGTADGVVMVEEYFVDTAVVYQDVCPESPRPTRSLAATPTTHTAGRTRNVFILQSRWVEGPDRSARQ